ncbi:AMP-binding protein [Patescibacteria group bacterium]|nr:AMP-binding protein [Patescibacteria group bacterium]
MLLTDILEESAKSFPNKTAFVMRTGYRTVSMTYGQVYDYSVKVATLLRNEGVGKGDKVLLLAPNSPFWVCAFWGCLLRGAVLVPLHTENTPELVKKIAEQTEAKIIFVDRRLEDKAPPELKMFELDVLWEVLEEIDDSGFQKTHRDEDDLAEIVYTSGTTGDPKGVMLTHKNISATIRSISDLIPIGTKDNFLSVLPLSHMFEQVAGFLMPFRAGATIVYAHSLAAIGELLKEHRITKMVAVPQILSIFMSRLEAKAEQAGKRKSFDALLHFSQKLNVTGIQRFLFRSVHRALGGKLRMVVCGGAPLEPELERKWNALGINTFQGYGLTETSPAVSSNTLTEQRLGSVGKIIPGVKVRIEPDGEILIKGPNIFGGYFKNEKKTKEAFTPDGWFKTDDIGEFDEDGFLYIKGRKKYMILGPGGENVYPEDLEFLLNKIPGVKDSAVIGEEKPGGQMEIHAVLLLADEAPTAKKIIEQANEKLASYQQITDWSVWPEEDFPRSATRKVKKGEVIEFIRREAGRRAAPRRKKKITPLMQLIVEITGEGAATVNLDTKFIQTLGYDSLLRVELVTRIEETFGVHIDEAKIKKDTTVADLEKMIKKAEPAVAKRRFKRWPISWWASHIRFFVQTFLFYPFWKIFIRLKVEGSEQLKHLTLPFIIMPNHLSYLDSQALLMALPSHMRKRMAFAVAEDMVYKKYKLIAWLLELLYNVFPFPRQEGARIQRGLEYTGRMLDQEQSVVVFPEGKMSKTGKLLPLKRGAGLMAIEMGVPIVPVKLQGTNDVLPYAKILPRRRGSVTVTFGKPIDLRHEADYVKATEIIQKKMQQL